MKNNEINCEKILIKDENVVNEVKANNDDSNELDKLVLQVESEMSNLNKLKTNLINFKNKMKPTQPKPVYNEEIFDIESQIKQLNNLSKKSRKTITEPTISQSSIQNLDLNSLENFLKKNKETNINPVSQEKTFLNEVKADKVDKAVSITSMEDTIKKLKDESKKETQKPTKPEEIGLSLSEIEKQIAMLKNLSIKN
jgi:hypothetical protein